ncbi:zinc finger CCCH domain-containing protein 35-like [Ananas comosus]|uniref:Zinc finger CCCH domain-containing protein 35-like n=1 Tax=Ananas comosus TaxID=4615 RepID=A0A6P5H7E2_ANACO|nr:zinc finger CCCH domain-containing protein 35-like [Ananas comosus]
MGGEVGERDDEATKEGEGVCLDTDRRVRESEGVGEAAWSRMSVRNEKEDESFKIFFFFFPPRDQLFESWLHPAQYRTRLCKDETGCARRVCFFAHKPDELHAVNPSLASVSAGLALPSPRSSNDDVAAAALILFQQQQQTLPPPSSSSPSSCCARRSSTRGSAPRAACTVNGVMVHHYTSYEEPAASRDTSARARPSGDVRLSPRR